MTPDELQADLIKAQQDLAQAQEQVTNWTQTAQGLQGVVQYLSVKIADAVEQDRVRSRPIGSLREA